MKGQRRELAKLVRIFGLPTDGTMTTMEEIIKHKALAPILEKVVSIRVWRRSSGEWVGTAEAEFKSEDDCNSAVKASRELRPRVCGKDVYINHPRTDLAASMDEPLKQARKKLENGWKGEDFRISIRVKWSERTIEGCGHVLCRQCEETLALRWYFPAHECTDEASIRRAADQH